MPNGHDLLFANHLRPLRKLPQRHLRLAFRDRVGFMTTAMALHKLGSTPLGIWL